MTDATKGMCHKHKPTANWIRINMNLGTQINVIRGLTKYHNYLILEQVPFILQTYATMDKWLI